jgi:hypothetical protein
MTVHIKFLLDYSGSMASIAKPTISGFNEFLEEQQKIETDEDVLFSLILFNTRVKVIYDQLPIAEVPRMTDELFMPNGMTAFYDALATAITEGTDGIEPDDKVIFGILTDGQENSSRLYTQRQVYKLVTGAQAKGWEILFLGANLADVHGYAQGLGIKAKNVGEFKTDAVGSMSAMRSVNAATMSYRGLVDTNSDWSKAAMQFADADGDMTKLYADIVNAITKEQSK